MPRYHDGTSVIGKAPTPEHHVNIAVVGAGPAGTAAALAAADAGADVMLIDENPVSAGLMALDVPLHFGQRMNAAVQNKARMAERLVETNPAVAEAFDRGIDVQLGVYAWGAFVNGPSVGSLDVPLLGLADEDRSWMVSFDRLILAAGARDLGLSFTGWERPGVMGVRAANLLLNRYQALDGRRFVVLGSDAAALGFALDAIAQGLQVVAVVEVSGHVQGPQELAAKLESAGVPILVRHAPREARGQADVEALVLARLNDTGRAVGDAETTLQCDTIVCAAGVVPSVELLDTLGCKLQFRSANGGYVPMTDECGRTSVARIFATGDCAGIAHAALANSDLAAEAGRRAGRAAAAELASGTVAAPTTFIASAAGPRTGVAAAQPWLEATHAICGDDTFVCLCEEVTRRELIELHPPRYLGNGADERHNLRQLSQDGPLNQDQVKRLTRAGMGPCQGRRCREQIQHILAGRDDMGAVALASYRPPVRPLPLAVMADMDERTIVAENWTAWFNIATQWTPHWEQQPVPFPARELSAKLEGK